MSSSPARRTWRPKIKGERGTSVSRPSCPDVMPRWPTSLSDQNPAGPSVLRPISCNSRKSSSASRSRLKLPNSPPSARDRSCMFDEFSARTRSPRQNLSTAVVSPLLRARCAFSQARVKRRYLRPPPENQMSSGESFCFKRVRQPVSEPKRVHLDGATDWRLCATRHRERPRWQRTVAWPYGPSEKAARHIVQYCAIW